MFSNQPKQRISALLASKKRSYQKNKSTFPGSIIVVKPVTDQELFLAVSYSKPALISATKNTFDVKRLKILEYIHAAQ